jgi:hypothetical protein
MSLPYLGLGEGSLSFSFEEGQIYIYIYAQVIKHHYMKTSGVAV